VIDRTNDGLSGMPADGTSLPLKRGTSARPAGPGSKVRLHQPRDGRKGAWQLLARARVLGCHGALTCTEAVHIPSVRSPPGHVRCSKQRARLAMIYSITSSARASSVGGMVRSSAFAVLMLMLVVS